MSHIDDTAEIITDPTAIDCGCSGGCGRMPDEMVITGTAGCAPLCIHCYTRAVREDERRQSAATPPPGTVAALLAVVDAAAKKAEAVAEAREYEAQEPHSIGVAVGLREAARLITAALGAPTPLDRAAAEVCALDVDMLAIFGTTTPTMTQGVRAIVDVVRDAFVQGQHPAQVKLATAIGLRVLAAAAKGGA